MNRKFSLSANLELKFCWKIYTKITKVISEAFLSDFLLKICIIWYKDIRKDMFCVCKMCSIGNLVMHFHKIAYIPWFYDAELWEWLRAGPHSYRRGHLFLCPYTKLYQFSTKNHQEKLQKWLVAAFLHTPLWFYIHLIQNFVNYQAAFKLHT